MRTFILKFLGVSALFSSVAGCSSTHPEEARYQPAIQEELAVTQTSKPSMASAPTPAPATLVKLPNPSSQQKSLKGIAAIQAANHQALQTPNSSSYINATMTYDYVAGALYQIYCAPLSVTDLQFESNEQLISIAAGDTLRWQLSKTYSGNTSQHEEHLLLKPSQPNLTNTLVVTTDRRTYHLLLHSTDQTFMASVRWQYPEGEDSFVTQYTSENAFKEKKNRPSTIPSLNLNQLDFHYQTVLVKGEEPDWMPSMIFNDGSKTYIQLPKSMQESPALFIGEDVKDGSQNQIVNYRVEGNYYVVDRVFSKGQLRSGQDKPTIVEIIHEGS